MKQSVLFALFITVFTSCATTEPVKKEQAVNIQKTEIAVLENRLQGNLAEKEKADIYVRLANLHLQENNYSKAVELLKSAEKLRSGQSPLHLNHYLGQAYYESADYKSAISYFRKSEDVDRDFESNQRKVMLVKSYFEEKDYGRALGLLGKLARDSGYKKDIFYYRTAALGFYKIREFSKGREMAMEGLKVFPDNIELNNILQDIESNYHSN